MQGYENVLGCKSWNLDSNPEEALIFVDGKPYKGAVSHNLGQVRKLLEGDFEKDDVIRLLA